MITIIERSKTMDVKEVWPNIEAALARITLLIEYNIPFTVQYN